MTRDVSRRSLLRLAGAAPLFGGVAGGTQGMIQSQNSGFSDDFDYATDQLEANGWTTERGSFETRDSSLFASSSGLHKDIYRTQTRATGTFEIRGARNTARFFGLRFAFISQTPNFIGDNPIGYLITFRGNGDVIFTRPDGPDGGEFLLKLDDNHGGDFHDVRIERDPDTYEFTLYYDGELVGTVEDDTYTESSYWVNLYDGRPGSQQVNGLSAGQSVTCREGLQRNIEEKEQLISGIQTTANRVFEIGVDSLQPGLVDQLIPDSTLEPLFTGNEQVEQRASEFIRRIPPADELSSEQICQYLEALERLVATERITQQVATYPVLNVPTIVPFTPTDNRSLMRQEVGRLMAAFETVLLEVIALGAGKAAEEFSTTLGENLFDGTV